MFSIVAALTHSASTWSVVFSGLAVGLIFGAAFSIATAVEIYKRLYPEGLEPFMYQMSPLYARLKKWKKFGGEGKFLVWEFANSPGASASFGNAQTNKGVTAFKRPLITRSNEYALASMDGESLDAAQGDENAIVSLFKVAMDDAKRNVVDSISIQLYRNGGGARGQLSSTTTVNTPTVTLANPQQTRGFQKGMVIRVSATDGTSGALRAGSVTLAAVNRIAGTLTATGNWNAGIAAIAASDFLFRDGDFGLTIKGLDKWIPTVAPTGGDNLFGVDRSDDPDWLAGIRYAPASGNYKEILVNAAALVQQVSGDGRPDLVMMNPIDWGNLANEVGSHMVIQVPTDNPKISFKGLSLFTGVGEMKVLGDPACPRFRSYMLQEDTWEIWTLGDVPKILDRDGLQTLREPSADADELRVGGRLQMVCKNPGKNAVITLPAN